LYLWSEKIGTDTRFGVITILAFNRGTEKMDQVVPKGDRGVEYIRNEGKTAARQTPSLEL
jgi:hypothetical protein